MMNCLLFTRRWSLPRPGRAHSDTDQTLWRTTLTQGLGKTRDIYLMVLIRSRDHVCLQVGPQSLPRRHDLQSARGQHWRGLKFKVTNLKILYAYQLQYSNPNRLYLFGGIDTSSGPPQGRNDIWEYEAVSDTWRKKAATLTEVPATGSMPYGGVILN